ncbi:MAG TPA: prenyltransferase/squalene oxidase repeat-containing protein [Anaerolineales bacterium]|nr:prenyltransferase/squalene oxidase repeat-containing protein [Anaerolineales bacterium]
MHFNPIPALLDWQDEALHYFVRRDLMEEQVPAMEALWTLPPASRLVHKQLEDGSWKYAGKTFDPDPGQNYFLLETYRNLRVLVEMYGMNREQPALALAAEYIFSCQTEEGDIRGIIGNQYMPYYHGAILELLIKAGYIEDERVNAGLDWLISMRQEDGGWIVPAQAVPSKERVPAFWSGEPVLPLRSLPHAHLATGMALRALASHPGYRRRPEVMAAGNCLKSRLLRADAFGDRKAPGYWLKFQFPYWWTSLLTALDTLSKLGFIAQDDDIGRGLDWFMAHQEQDGLWPTGYGSGKQAEGNRLWVGLAICRVIKELKGYSFALS